MGAKFRRRAMLWWPKGRPHRVLVVKKQDDAAATDMLRQIASWLKDRDVEVLVEPSVQAAGFGDLSAWTNDDAIPDFCITLGGDGTVLHTASLFKEDHALPPMLAFAMGTLGFLTPFQASGFEPLLSRVMQANYKAVFCTLRTRLDCEVYHGEALVSRSQAFNEACLDRGLGLNFLQMECHIDGEYVTTIQGDGLIVATPSGSTAYSLSAGGPMVAPSVPCVIMTPIAPHSLSFRPIVVSETSDIVIHIPADFNHQGARVSFDGKDTQMLSPNDSVRMVVTKWPLPMITASTMDQDWFISITKKLAWNSLIKKGAETRSKELPFAAVCQINDAALDVPSCVQWPRPDVLMAGYHMGQNVDEVDDGMPLYSVNGSDKPKPEAS